MKTTIKGYLSAVNRRLRLPRQIRRRLISDLQTTIDARLEQGETWQSIVQSLGSPADRAKDYMEQMQEFAYRKSPWRFPLGIGAVLCTLLAVWEGLTWLLAEFLMQPPAASVGIIGGADGPTAIFVTGVQGTWFPGAKWLLLALGCGVGYWLLCHCKQKFSHCSQK